MITWETKGTKSMQQHSTLFANPLFNDSSFSFLSPEDDVIPEEAIELFDKVDNLLEGPSSDHLVALQLLDSYKNEVWELSIYFSDLLMFFIFNGFLVSIEC